MIVLLWALLLQTTSDHGAAATAPPPTAPAAEKAARPNDVVVTGRPLALTERALAECIARHCPPREDIAASIAHAENQVLAGDYYGARKTLLAARGRDRRYAAELPVEVGNLLRASGRVANYVGMPSSSRINQIESFEALKKGLPPGDAQVLAQRLEVGDAFAKQGDFDSAIHAYREVGRQARRSGQVMVAGLTTLREAVLYAAVATIAPAYLDSAKDACNRLLRTTDPTLEPFREAAAELLRELKSGNQSTTVTIPSDARTAPPRVLYQRPFDDNQLRAINSLSRYGGGDFIQWADVAFHIDFDGTVKDVAILRHSEPFDAKWVEVARTALLKRRYTGYPVDAAPPGVDRLERYSRSYDVGEVVGSHLSGRSTTPRIEVMDLTGTATTK